MLFVGAKAAQLELSPAGAARERQRRALAMVRQMDKEGFGNCTNQYECEAACPKEISVRWITKLNRDYAIAALPHLKELEEEQRRRLFLRHALGTANDAAALAHITVCLDFSDDAAAFAHIAIGFHLADDAAAFANASAALDLALDAAVDANVAVFLKLTHDAAVQAHLPAVFHLTDHGASHTNVASQGARTDDQK
jgi:hypothetical protein